jgi:F0F1-type ATP synthase assembly protein I
MPAQNASAMLDHISPSPATLCRLVIAVIVGMCAGVVIVRLRRQQD